MINPDACYSKSWHYMHFFHKNKSDIDIQSSFQFWCITHETCKELTYYVIIRYISKYVGNAFESNLHWELDEAIVVLLNFL